MKIATKYHGELEVIEQDTISFPNGLPGFQEEKQFMIIPFSEDGMFQILQSINTPQLGLVMTNPFVFFSDYDFQLEDQAIETLKVNTPEDVVVYTILTVQDPLDKTTANLQAPIVMNKASKLGKQLILTGTSYLTKHQLFEKAEAK